jgi:hypothetical protein
MFFSWRKSQLGQLGFRTLDDSAHQVAHLQGLLSLQYLDSLLNAISVANHRFERVLVKVRYSEFGFHIETGISEPFHVVEISDRLLHDRDTPLLQKMSIFDNLRVVWIYRH